MRPGGTRRRKRLSGQAVEKSLTTSALVGVSSEPAGIVKERYLWPSQLRAIWSRASCAVSRSRLCTSPRLCGAAARRLAPQTWTRLRRTSGVRPWRATNLLSQRCPLLPRRLRRRGSAEGVGLTKAWWGLIAHKTAATRETLCCLW